MDRRTLLATLPAAATAALAGCLADLPVVGAERPVVVKATRARDRTATDVTCELSRRLVESEPALATVLERAAGRAAGEWTRRDVSLATGDAVAGALETHCETTGGLYFYRGRAYWISVAFKRAEDAAAHHGHNHTHTG